MLRKSLLAALAFALVGVGAADTASAQTCVSSNVTTDTTWSGTVILENPIFVTDDAVLTILPGTIVRGQPRTAAVTPGVVTGTPGALVVATDGMILADGTPDSPIVFTTAALDADGNNIPDTSGGFLAPCNCADNCSTAVFYDDTPTTAPLAPLAVNDTPNVSLWGGVVINGCAPTNLADAGALAANIVASPPTPFVSDCGSGEATVEGLTVPGFSADLAGYGGEDTNDTSGSLTYFSIRHAGDEIGAGNELNGLTMAGVGQATTIENGEVYANFDDGFEWFGGTANAKNLGVFYIGDDSYDVDQGHQGVVQFALSISTPFTTSGGYGSADGDHCGEFDGGAAQRDVSGDPVPLQSTLFLNLTCLGNDDLASPEFDLAAAGLDGADNPGITFEDEFGGGVHNSMIFNTGSEPCIDIVDGSTPGIAGGAEDIYTVSVMATTCINHGGFDTTLRDSGTTEALTLPGTLPTLSANCDTLPGTPLSLVDADVTFDPSGNAGGKLASSLRSSPIDPRVDGSSGLQCNGGAVPSYGHGVENVSFRGSSDASLPLFTTPWSALNIGGILAD